MLLALWLPLAILFETPLTAALVAGGAVSIPIIIHLLNRRRFKIVQWAAMRFLLAAQKKNSRRMRLEQLLLLIVRCLIVLLIALAMISVTGWAESSWRWLFPDSVATVVGGTQRTHKILVIDGSYSMGTRLEDATCFDKARSLAAKMVREDSRASYSVVLMSRTARHIVAEPSEDRERVAREIEKLQLPHGNADLKAALASIDGLLKKSPGKFGAREVYFFTDLQRSTWEDRQPAEVAESLKSIEQRALTVLVDLGPETLPPNLAVTALRVEEDFVTINRQALFSVEIHNYGNEPIENVRVKVEIGMARRNAADPDFVWHNVEPINLARVDHGSVTQTFTRSFDKPGEYALRATLETKDGLDIDDARQVVLTVKDQVEVLLVNGKADGHPFRQQSAGWLRYALNPDGIASKENPFHVTTLTSAQFNDPTLGDLTKFDCVFLCDVPEVFDASAKRLTDLVRRGGGVVFFLGPQVNLKRYNEDLYKDGLGLLPLPLKGIESLGDNDPYQFQFDWKPKAIELDPLKAFRVQQFFSLGKPPPGVALGNGPRTILSFIPVRVPGRDGGVREGVKPEGGPAVLEWNPPAGADLEKVRRAVSDDKAEARLRGRAVLITTTANALWGTWPTSPSYPAFMLELLPFAAAGRLRERSGEVGDPLELFLANKLDLAEAKITLPDTRKESVYSKNLGLSTVVRWLDTDLSGLYKVTVGGNPQEHLFAINPPSVNEAGSGSESNLVRISAEEMRDLYRDADKFQVIRDLAKVDRSVGPENTQELLYVPLGGSYARWLLLLALALVVGEIVLAWVFGHYTSTALKEQEQTTRRSAGWERILSIMPWLLIAVLMMIGGVLIHNQITGDFLGFLPEGLRRWYESLMGIPAPEDGEGSRWRLEFGAYFLDAASDPWLAGTLFLATLGLMIVIYPREGHKVGVGPKLLLGVMRLGLLALMLSVLLPQVKLYFERNGWPDVVILIDDSYSMSANDKFSDSRISDAANKLIETSKDSLTEMLERRLTKANPEMTVEDRQRRVRELLAQPERLMLAQALLTRSDPSWLSQLITQKKVRLHVYHCSIRTNRVIDANGPGDIAGMRDAILSLEARKENDSSQLGGAIRQVIDEYRGATLAGIIMITDGVTTEGENIEKASKYAQLKNVPLFFVGIGDAHDVRDVYLHDLHCDDNVFVNDKINFEFSLTARGYSARRVPVTLREKGNPKILDRKEIEIDPSGKSVPVKLQHTPTDAGEKVYEIDTPVQEEEVDKDNNHLERAVKVNESKLIRILYVEGYRRYEYWFIKTLLERESARTKGNKTMDLKVLLLDADEAYAAQDRSAISTFPSRAELLDRGKNGFDVVILGDVDPKASDPKKLPKEWLKDLQEFVKVKGGGLLMIAGERYSPQAYKDTGLADVLPIDVIGNRPADVEDKELKDRYSLELTPTGRLHPIFRLASDEKENDEIWRRLRGMYWSADGYEPKPAAEVLAVHPTVKAQGAGKGKHPLVLQHFVGAGRAMFFGFNETWRWGFREDQVYFNRFWIQTVRFLARNRSDRYEILLDQQVPYARGQGIKVTVRYPNDADPPPDGAMVKVTVEQSSPLKARLPLKLTKIPGSRGTFQAVETDTPEGVYTFTLSELHDGKTPPMPFPKVTCKVLAPPGELHGLRLNQPELEAAAENTHGEFFSLADADKLPEKIPTVTRPTINVPGPPSIVWNNILLFMLVLLLLSTEWLMRKKFNLL